MLLCISCNSPPPTPRPPSYICPSATRPPPAPAVLKAIPRASAGRLAPARKAERRAGRPTGRGPGALPRYLTQDELARFRRAVVAGGELRDVALFGLMYRFGLRAIETT